MTSKPAVHILGVPLDHGAGRRGVGMGPSALRIAGLADKLTSMGIKVTDHGDVLIKDPERSKTKTDANANHLDLITRTCNATHEHVKRIASKGGFPLVIGGDHSIAIGTIAGLSAALRAKNPDSQLGVIWIDAHADLNTPETSPSGNIHGMPVAVTIGKGPEPLTNIGGFIGKVQADNFVLVGLRDIDKAEKQAIADSGVHAFTMKDIDERGMAKVMRDAISIAGTNTDALHVSFDIDSVDPRIAPGTGTAVWGGLTYREAHLAMEMVAETGLLTSMEMVEVNPILDTYNMTAGIATELIASALGKTIL